VSGVVTGTAGTSVLAGATIVLASGNALATRPLTVSSFGKASVSGNTATSVAGLDISGTGLFDVVSGQVTAGAGLTPVTLVAKILEGRGDGTWNGTSGITSSAVAADVAVSIPRAIGWLDNGGGSMAFAYSAPGDTNIDNTVDILDAANFLAAGKFDSGLPASWNDGDFGYDGMVDILDAADFLSTGLFDAGPYNAFSAAPLGGTIDVVADKTLTVPGPITGGGRLTKSGSGTLVLSGLHARGTPGRDRDHRHAHRPAVARGAERPRVGPPHAVRESHAAGGPRHDVVRKREEAAAAAAAHDRGEWHHRVVGCHAAGHDPALLRGVGEVLAV